MYSAILNELMSIKAQFAAVIPMSVSPVEKEPQEATPVEVAPIKEQLPVFDDQKEAPAVEESAEPIEEKPAEEMPVEEEEVKEMPIEKEEVKEKAVEKAVEKEEVKEVEKPATLKEAEKQGERRPRYRGRKEEAVDAVGESEV